MSLSLPHAPEGLVISVGKMAGFIFWGAVSGLITQTLRQAIKFRRGFKIIILVNLLVSSSCCHFGLMMAVFCPPFVHAHASPAWSWVHPSVPLSSSWAEGLEPWDFTWPQHAFFCAISKINPAPPPPPRLSARAHRQITSSWRGPDLCQPLLRLYLKSGRVFVNRM